jgi:hypothetical protein
VIKLINAHHATRNCFGLAVSPGNEKLILPQDTEVKKLHDGLVIVCPNCGALCPVDEELLKRF